MGKTFYLIDRTRVEVREECPRKRYWEYDFGLPEDLEPTGLDTESGSLPLLSGIAIHAAHARLLAGEGLEIVLESVITDYSTELANRGLANMAVTSDLIREQAALLEGMLRAWATLRLPRILEEYSVESIEQRWDWEMAPGLVERIRMDAILVRRDDGLRHILDYKTVGYPSELFFEQKEHSLQTALYIQALKERTGEPVGGILYEGLVKGQMRKDTARNSPWFGQKIQQSPYTLAYALRGEAGTLYQTDYTSKKGYRKVRPFDEMPMREWMEHYLIPGGEGFAALNDLFIVMPVICPPDSELLRVKNQTIAEELQYHQDLANHRRLLSMESRGEQLPGTADAYLDRFAPLRTGRCYKYGLDNKCKFIDICFNSGAEPLAEGGGYVRRKPHHETDHEVIA